MAEHNTATVRSAREHARAQAGSRGTGQDSGDRSGPAPPPTDLPEEVAAADVLWEETLAAGGYASRVVPSGSRVRFVDHDGDTNLNLVLHHAVRPAERLNVADTMKLQWNAYPTAGSLLLSDMGRVLATVLTSSGGPLDLLCGASTPATARARYGASGSDSATPCGRDRLLLGLAKNDLGQADLPPAANLFSRVRVGPGGALGLVHLDGNVDPAAARQVTLRAELDLLVTVAVTPHPLDDRSTYTAGPVGVTAWSGQPAAPDDRARHTSPEARRAFENTDAVGPSAARVGPTSSQESP